MDWKIGSSILNWLQQQELARVALGKLCYARVLPTVVLDTAPNSIGQLT